MSAIDNKLATVKDGEPGKSGKDADENLIIKKVISQITPSILERIKNHLLSLLDIKNIKGLEDYDEIKKIAGEKRVYMVGGRRGSVLRAVDLSSQCDGIIKAFTLPIDVRKVFGLFGTQFPVQFAPTGDWSVSGRTLTLGDSVGAPAIGQTLWALCEVL